MLPPVQFAQTTTNSKPYGSTLSPKASISQDLFTPQFGMTQSRLNYRRVPGSSGLSVCPTFLIYLAVKNSGRNPVETGSMPFDGRTNVRVVEQDGSTRRSLDDFKLARDQETTLMPGQYIKEGNVFWYITLDSRDKPSLVKLNRSFNPNHYSRNPERYVLKNLDYLNIYNFRNAFYTLDVSRRLQKIEVQFTEGGPFIDVTGMHKIAGGSEIPVTGDMKMRINGRPETTVNQLLGD